MFKRGGMKDYLACWFSWKHNGVYKSISFVHIQFNSKEFYIFTDNVPVLKTCVVKKMNKSSEY